MLRSEITFIFEISTTLVRLIEGKSAHGTQHEEEASLFYDLNWQRTTSTCGYTQNDEIESRGLAQKVSSFSFELSFIRHSKQRVTKIFRAIKIPQCFFFGHPLHVGKSHDLRQYSSSWCWVRIPKVARFCNHRAAIFLPRADIYRMRKKISTRHETIRV